MIISFVIHGFVKMSPMQYKLPRQEISPEILSFGLRKLREHDLFIPRAGRVHLRQIAAVARRIRSAGLPKGLMVRRLEGKLGFGVFLRADARVILRGEVIAPYSGDVYVSPQNQGEGSDYAFSLLSDLKLTREEQKQFDPDRSFHPGRLYSIDLDADKKGNFTRFINHSAKPNVEARLVRVAKGAPFEIIYFAKKKILPGEQLLVCYEGEDKSYWGALNIKPFPMDPQTFRLSKSLKIYK